MNTSFRRNDFSDLWFEDKRYLWLLEYRWPIRNYRLSTHKKKSQKSLVPFLPRVSEEGNWFCEKWIFLVWNWGKFSESLPHWYYTSIFQESSPWAQPTVLRQIIPPNLVCVRHSSHWHFLCMSILFNPFIYVNRRKLALYLLAWLCEICPSA